MIRLAFAELRDGWRAWAGMLFMITVTSTILGACATIASTWLDYTGQERGVSDVLAQLTIMISGFSGLTAIVVLSSVASIAVQSDRERYARWQLLGFTPHQVRTIIALQLGTLAVIGAVIGLLTAVFLSQAVIDLVVSAIQTATGKGATVPASISLPIFAGTGLAIVVIILISGLAPAHRASRIPAIEVLRSEEPPAQGMTILRWITTGLCLAATIGLLASAIGNNVDIITLNTIFACILLAGAIASAAPIVLPPVIALWPRIVPERLSLTWFLARTSALERLSYSSSSVTPLLVGITLIGSIYSAAYTQRDAMLANGIPVDQMELANDQVIIMLGGPLILAACGAATSVFQGTEHRQNAARVFSRMGIQRSSLLVAALLEAIIYVLTAVLIALVVIGVIVVIEVFALRDAVGPSFPTITFGPILAVAAVGLVVVAAGAVLPLARMKL